MTSYIRTTFDKSKCVDLPANESKNGNQIQLWDCHGGDAQKFKYIPSTLEIKHLPSNKCVDLHSNIRDNGNKIQLWDCHGGDNQKWKHEGNLIKLNNTNKCIDIPWGDLKSGNKLQLWDCNNTQAQQFDLITNIGSFSTQCKKDEDFNSVWGRGGNTAKLKAMQECSDKGYYNNTINDCGGWNFSATCKDSVPSDWSRPFSDEHARELGKQNRDQAINDDCKSKGFFGYIGEFKEVGNHWNFSGKCGNPDYIGDWVKEESKKIKIDKYSRHVNAKNFDWIEAANYLKNNLPDTFNNKKIIEKRIERRDHLNNIIPLTHTQIGTRMVVVIEIENVENVPKLKGEWKEIRCSNGIKIIQNQVEAFSFGWEESAQYLLDTLKDTFDNKKIIKKYYEKNVIDGIFVKLELEDDTCFNDPTKIITGNPPKLSFTSLGDFGEYNPVIFNALTKDSIFVLEAVNWISGNKNKKTFLKGDGGSIRTDDNVLIQGDDLNKMFHFKFELDKCKSHSYITYGSRFQLKNIGINKFIQCGGGTCSAVDNSGDCLKESWQTFKLVSNTGKSDGEPVFYGDDVYFVQVVNDKVAITPAGNTEVWARDIGSNQNSILRILPIKGSLYKDKSSIQKEIEEYNKKRDENLCSKDPLNPICTEKNLKNFGEDFKKYIQYLVIVIIIILVLVIIIKLI